jgi:hypothetical protein
MRRAALAVAAVLTCGAAAMAAEATTRPATAPATRPATQPATLPAVVRDVPGWLQWTSVQASRLTDSFGARPLVVPSRRVVHVFAWSKPRSATSSRQVDAAAVARRVVPEKHPAALRAACVHWVDEPTDQIVTATVDVGALDGFRGGVFSVRQLLELVEVEAKEGAAVRFESASSVAGAGVEAPQVPQAVAEALGEVLAQICLSERLKDRVRRLAVEPTTEPATQATQPAARHFQIGELKLALQGEGQAARAEVLGAAELGPLKLIDRLAEGGIYVGPWTDKQGAVKLAAVCALTGAAAGGPEVRVAAEPETQPAAEPDEPDLPLPEID